jgi:hypothetical protein
MAYELTEFAEHDVKGILRDTHTIFGDHQLTAYAHIIDKGMTMVGDDAERGGSIDRPEGRIVSHRGRNEPKLPYCWRRHHRSSPPLRRALGTR